MRIVKDMRTIDLKSLRTRLGMSQQALADYLGVNQATVSRLEQGQRPSGPVLKLIEQLEGKAA